MQAALCLGQCLSWHLRPQKCVLRQPVHVSVACWPHTTQRVKALKGGLGGAKAAAEEALLAELGVAIFFLSFLVLSFEVGEGSDALSDCSTDEDADGRPGEAAGKAVALSAGGGKEALQSGLCSFQCFF